MLKSFFVFRWLKCWSPSYPMNWCEEDNIFVLSDFKTAFVPMRIHNVGHCTHRGKHVISKCDISCCQYVCCVPNTANWHVNNSDVIMIPMASQMSSHKIVYSTVYSRSDQRRHQSSASLDFVAQRASNAELVSIWWRHHAFRAYISLITADAENALVIVAKNIQW